MKTTYKSTTPKDEAYKQAAAEPGAEAAESEVQAMDHMNEASEDDAGADMASFVNDLNDSEFTQLCAACDARKSSVDKAKTPGKRAAEADLSMEDFSD